MITILTPGSDSYFTRMGTLFCECQVQTVGMIVQTFCIFTAFGCLLVWFSATFLSLPERAALKSLLSLWNGLFLPLILSHFA